MDRDSEKATREGAKLHLRSPPGFLFRVVAGLLALPLLLLMGGTSSGEDHSIRILSSSATSEFPMGMRFTLEATGDSPIESMKVTYNVGLQSISVYDYLKFESGEIVDGDLLVRTNTSAKYIPPGSIVTYRFEIEDSEGEKLVTEPRQFVFDDSRFDWKEVSSGPVAVLYHGPVRTRAETISDAILSTLDRMGPVLGAETETPIRVTMYNNVKEMIDALPPGSATIRRELITEGQAFANHGVLLVLGGGRLSTGTASHEVMHILTNRAAGRIPRWLDEGLAEYGNVAPGFSYSIALEFAIEVDRLLPITAQEVPPGDPEDAIIFYAQARSIVRFMVDGLGPDKMRELMARMKAGMNIDRAIRAVYNTDRTGLENAWRMAVRAPLYTPPEVGTLLPTPLPLPAVLLYSLTPQAQSAPIVGTAATPTPEAEEIVTEPIEVVVVATDVEKEPREAEKEPKKTEEEPSGGGCNAPRSGGARAMDLSAVFLAVGLAGLGARRRLLGRG